jgi:hypothetical protein
VESFGDEFEPTKQKTHQRQISMDMIEATQQRAAERWQEKQRARELGLAGLEQDHAGEINQQTDSLENDLLAQKNIPTHDLSPGGLEDELDL